LIHFYKSLQKMSESGSSRPLSRSGSISSDFAPPSRINLEKICSKAPQPWKKPRSRMYEYNRVLGNEYYQPMVDYVLCKENQGVYHDYNIRHSTDLNEAGKEGLLTYPDLNDFLVKGYAKQIKERNQATASSFYLAVRGSKAVESPVEGRKTAAMLRDHYLRELRCLRDGRTPGAEYGYL